MSFEITTTQGIKTYYPVNLTEAREQLSMYDDQTDDDGFIERLIEAATQECEDIIQKDIAKTRYTSYIHDFSGDNFQIAKSNLFEIEGIVDVNDASINVDSDETRTWPEYFDITLTSSVTTDPLTVQYTCGYDEDLCPAVMKQAILIAVKTMYDVERDNYTMGSMKNNKVVERLLSRYRSVADLR